jgi:hypothetical protein
VLLALRELLGCLDRLDRLDRLGRLVFWLMVITAFADGCLAAASAITSRLAIWCSELKPICPMRKCREIHCSVE